MDNKRKEMTIIIFLVVVFLTPLFFIVWSSSIKKKDNNIVGDNYEILDKCDKQPGGTSSYYHEFLCRDKTTGDYIVKGYDSTEKEYYDYSEYGYKTSEQTDYVKDNFSKYKKIYMKYIYFADGKYSKDSYADVRIVIDPNNYKDEDIQNIKKRISEDNELYEITIYFTKGISTNNNDLYNQFLTSQYGEECRDDFATKFNSKHNKMFYEGYDSWGNKVVARYQTGNYSTTTNTRKSIEAYINSGYREKI